MTVQTPQGQAQNDQQKQNDKELNFRQLEARYEKQLAQEREARMAAERLAQERTQVHAKEEEDDAEPYVDHKRLDKKLAKFGQSTQSDIQRAMETAKEAAKQELKQEMWLESNPDFYEVLGHAEKFAQAAPELAKNILSMPEGFERQRLVYNNIKALKINQPEVKQQSIQEKVDANRRSPYYQPSGVGSAPYASAGDFSASGQKNAYDKMQELKARLKL